MIWDNDTDLQDNLEEDPQEAAETGTDACTGQADENHDNAGNGTGTADDPQEPEGGAGEEQAEGDPQAEDVKDAGSEETADADESGDAEASKDKKDAQIADLKDRLMRQMAEFDNYRKRTDKEKAQNYDIGESDFLLKLLPVVDNFERGMSAMSEEDKASSFGQGMELIYKQLTKLLDDEGVKEIEALGKEFDPALHNAVMQQPSEEYESGTVMQVLQKGYTFKDRILRHSMVMVAQ